MKLRHLFVGLVCLAALCSLSACKDRRDDNSRTPDAWSDNPVRNHRFDGGATDPYAKLGKSGSGQQGGE